LLPSFTIATDPYKFGKQRQPAAGGVEGNAILAAERIDGGEGRF
jgi:hypothetical protein